MFNNYFYLNRCAVELNKILSGNKFYNAFTQEKNKLYLNCSTDEFPDRHLVISTDQNIPYLLIKENHKKAKKNVFDFFTEFFPSNLITVLTAVSDRIILLKFENFDLFYILRGKDSNIVAVSEDKFNQFQKFSYTKPDELKDELFSLEYTSEYNLPDLEELQGKSYTEIKKNNPAFTKDIIFEAETRSTVQKPEVLRESIDDIFYKSIAVFWNEENDKADFAPASYVSKNGLEFGETFPDFNTALLKYISLKFSTEKNLRIKKELEKYFDKELGKLAGKLNQLKSRIETGSRDKEYNNYGGIILANLYKIKKGDKEISAEVFDSGKEIIIKLDEKLTPAENAEKYFDKSKSEKTNFEVSKRLYESTKTDYDRLKILQGKSEQTEDVNELQNIKNNLNIKQKQTHQNKMEEKINYRHYIIDGKYDLYVGRDSKSNDMLTVKFAKQNDYWFHARGLPGSHVVLRNNNPKEGIPKNILKIAASIAAYYSKAKTAGTAPVAFTNAKYVTKKKGMAPGQVIMQKEDVLLVKPEIPTNCEYVED